MVCVKTCRGAVELSEARNEKGKEVPTLHIHQPGVALTYAQGHVGKHLWALKGDGTSVLVTPVIREALDWAALVFAEEVYVTSGWYLAKHGGMQRVRWLEGRLHTVVWVSGGSAGVSVYLAHLKTMGDID